MASSAIIHSIIIDHISLFTTVRIASTFVYNDIVCIIRVLVCLCGIKLYMLCCFIVAVFLCVIMHCQHQLGRNARKPVFGGFANNTGADQSAHQRSLISASVIRCLISIISILALTKNSII